MSVIAPKISQYKECYVKLVFALIDDKGKQSCKRSQLVLVNGLWVKKH